MDITTAKIEINDSINAFTDSVLDTVRSLLDASWKNDMSLDTWNSISRSLKDVRKHLDNVTGKCDDILEFIHDTNPDTEPDEPRFAGDEYGWDDVEADIDRLPF